MIRVVYLLFVLLTITNCSLNPVINHHGVHNLDLKQSKIIIGNESGPMCIGAALNKKVISIYHPEHTNKSSLIINKKVNFINTKQISAKKIISKILKFL